MSKWEEKKLGDICLIARGGSPRPIKSFLTNDEDGVNWIKIGDAEIGSKYIYNTKEKILQSGVSHSRYVEEGDFLLSNSMSFGRPYILKTNGCIHDGWLVLKNYEKSYIQDFLYYLLSSPYLVNQFKTSARGSTVQNLNSDIVSKVKVPVPPLPEQTRIVEKLDAAFEKIDRLKENAEKGLQEVKNLWQATVTKELSHREGWTETTIGDICEIVRGKRFVRADIVENGVPCIHYGDMYTHYGMSATKSKGCVSPELAKKLRFANKNDVVVVAAGENKYDIGVGMVWLGSEPAVVHDACFILKHSQNPMFLSYYFRSTPYHQYLKDEVNEGKICSFLTKPLAAAKISLPPLAVQNEIVKKLDDVRDRVEKLIANYKETIDSYAPLKQAILRKAFSGKL